MGIATMAAPQPPSVGTNGGAPVTPSRVETPTFLAGETLTFPLITGVGTAAITLWSAWREVQPTVGLVIVVAIICGLVVTGWGWADAKQKNSGNASFNAIEFSKRTIIGALNTVLLAAALWGTVAVSQAAYATG